MLRSVFTKTLWERRVSMIWWVLSTTLLSIWMVGFYPTIRDSEELRDFILDFPEEMLALFGIDPAIYTTGFGYLQSQMYSLIAPMLVIALCVAVGAAATAGEEESGTIDLLLATPTSRDRVMVDKFLALAVLAAALVLTIVVILVVANPLLDLKLSTLGIVGVNLGLLWLGLLFGALAMAVGAWRGSRSVAAGVAGGVAIVAWFANGFAPLIGWLETVNRFLPFDWYLRDDPLLDGPTRWHLLLATVTLVLLAVGIFAFRARDVRSQQPLISRRADPDEESQATADAKPGRLDGMLGKVFTKTVWERRRTIWWWVIGLGSIAALTAAFWPSLSGNAGDGMQAFLESLPREMLAMFGITDPTILLTPEGFLSARLYSSIGTIVMLVFAIGMGAGTLAGEERSGTMDLLLGTPTRRRVVARDKLGALLALVGFLALTLLVVVLISGAAVDMGLDPLFVLSANAGLALLTLFFGVMALAVGAYTGRPAIATGVASGLAVAAYVLNGFGAAIDGLAAVRWASPFFWYLRDSPPLARGFTATYWLLAAGIAVFALAAIPGFRRRDIGT